MNGTAAIPILGEPLLMLPHRCLFRPASGTLILADPHFGKTAAFRAAGIGVPEGGTQHDLDRLDAALKITHAHRLLILGDFFHHRGGRTPAVLGLLTAWRHAHPDLEILLLPGNHDRHAGPPPQAWGIQTVPGPYREGRLAFAHNPSTTADGYLVAGHLHPGVTLTETGRDRLTAPCFLFTPQYAVLPAFGGFTGVHRIHPPPGSRVFPVGPDCVVEAVMADASKPTPMPPRP